MIRATLLLPAVLVALFEQRQYWSVYRFYRGLVYLPRLISTITELIAIVNMLVRRNLLGLLRVQPMLPFNYLSSFYLSLAFDSRDRAAALRHHIDRIGAAFSPAFLALVYGRGAVLFREWAKSGHELSVVLRASDPRVKEGEWSLVFLFNGHVFYFLSFSCVPGRIVGIGADSVILVTRLQGGRDSMAAIRIATKALKEVAPSAFLLQILMGIAESLDIHHLVGVPADRHVSLAWQKTVDLSQSYDGFFQALGIPANQAGYFAAPIPLPEKPLDDIRADHRARTRRKRRYKREITESAALLMRQNLRSGYQAAQHVVEYPAMAEIVQLVHCVDAAE